MGDVRRVSLKEFQDQAGPKGLESALNRINGGTFMACHQAIAAETGMWIDELVPVFQKLDAMLVTRELPESLRY